MQEIKNKLQSRTVQILNDQDTSLAAVLLPLLYYQGKPSLLFEVRSQELKGQPGEICFPGGRIESNDQSPQDAALRETSEEVGIPKTNIELLGSLDVLVTPFFFLYPYVGYIKEPTIINPSKNEVEEIFIAPLEDLYAINPVISHTNIKITPEPDFPNHLLPNGKDYGWRSGKYPVYFYSYGEYVIWGITARILHHFLGVIR